MEMLVKLKFSYGFSRGGESQMLAVLLKDQESMNRLFWIGYCLKPEHSVKEHGVLLLL